MSNEIRGTVEWFTGGDDLINFSVETFDSTYRVKVSTNDHLFVYSVDVWPCMLEMSRMINNALEYENALGKAHSIAFNSGFSVTVT